MIILWNSMILITFVSIENNYLISMIFVMRLCKSLILLVFVILGGDSNICMNFIIITLNSKIFMIFVILAWKFQDVHDFLNFQIES